MAVLEKEITVSKEEKDVVSISLILTNINIYIYNFIKRIIDILAGLVGVFFFLIIALFVKVAKIINRDKSRLIYSHKRIGKNGELFNFYKFQSMLEDSEGILTELLKDPARKKEWKKFRKFEDDPRITKVGKFLRKTSLDEFAQFINVLKGDMSLIGPRPYMPREEEDMGFYKKEIIKSKPGITGLWQVSGRNNTTFEERMDLDKQYSKKKSLWFDFKILVKTFLQVFKKDGAM